MTIGEQYVKEDFERFVSSDNQTFEDAQLLNSKLSKPIFDERSPNHFFGDYFSKTVCITLNPYRGIDYFPTEDQNRESKNLKYSYENYWNYYSNYGKHKYGSSSKSERFDTKQVTFFKAAELLDLEDSSKGETLVKLFVNKLQWEFIPFGSPKFIFQNVFANNQQLLRKYISRTLDVIFDQPRDHVLFLGAVFMNLLKEEFVTPTGNNFIGAVEKLNGSMTSGDNFEITETIISMNGKSIIAYFLPHFYYLINSPYGYGLELRKLMDKSAG